MSDPIFQELRRQYGLSSPERGQQPREFTTDDGSVYRGVPADEFEDFSDVDHADVDPATGKVRA